MTTDAELELERALASMDDPRVRLEVPADRAVIHWLEIDAIDRLTLSMFGQLPDAPYDLITPIARVRPPSAGEYVIGVDPDGRLVRSSFSDAWADVPRNDREARHMTDDLVRLRERVAHHEEALARQAGFMHALEAFQALPTVLFVQESKRKKED